MLAAQHLQISIGGKTVCHDLNFNAIRGECIAILGRNGVGKTTLLHTLAGLRAPQRGRVTLAGAALSKIRRRDIARALGIVMQQAHDSFPATVFDTVLVGRHPHIGFWSWESSSDIAIAQQALADCGLAGMEGRLVATLSGGERRRLAIATVLAQAPEVYLLDEPTNELDLQFQIQLLEHIRHLAVREHKTVLFNMHDVNLAARFADRILLLLGRGDYLFGSTHTQLTDANLSRAYGVPVAVHQHGGHTVFIPGATS